MNKKIIFVGPANAGKTTLRKVFFESENSSKLLEFGLEPTHGKESILMKFDEKIGVFDLAGQENQRWFETEDKDIFYGSKILIVVIDVSDTLENILSFTKKILKIRRDLTPSSYIYLLLHKKDLVNQEKLSELKSKLEKIITGEANIKVAFTSIQREFFTETFSIFIDILKTCMNESIGEKKIDLNLIKNLIDLLYFLQQDAETLKTDLYSKLEISNQIVDHLINVLKINDLIKLSKKERRPKISLTDKGNNYLNRILNEFSPENLYNYEVSKFGWVMENVKLPPILGFMISDNHGKTIISTEVYEGAFDSFLKFGKEGSEIEYKLIPMLISALERVSDMRNTRHLHGIELYGTNIKMLKVRFDLFTITIYMHIDTNIKPFKNEITDWFQNVFKQNRKEFETYIQNGHFNLDSHFTDLSKNWLINLNSKYEKKSADLEILDINQSKNFYLRLDEISGQINDSNILQKIKKLKFQIVKAILEGNYREIRKTVLKIKDLVV